MDIKNKLTREEQEVILRYIRNNVHQKPVNLNELPMWLYELVIISYKWNRLPRFIKWIFDR